MPPADTQQLNICMSFQLTPAQLRAEAMFDDEAASHFLLYGASRSSKTFGIARHICERALIAPNSHHLILRNVRNDAESKLFAGTYRDVMRLAFPTIKYARNKSDLTYTFGNGSVLQFFGMADEAQMEKVLGAEGSTIHVSEANDLTFAKVEILWSRLAEKAEIDPHYADQIDPWRDKSQAMYLEPRAFYDLNPTTRSSWDYQLFFEKKIPHTNELLENPEAFRSMHCALADNAENVSSQYKRIFKSMTKKRRLRFEAGEYQLDNPYALFSRDDIKIRDKLGGFDRIVLALDPAGDGTETNDETGIMICGKSGDDFYVMADLSGKFSPAEVSKIVADAYDAFKVDAVIVEKNYGGRWIETMLRTEHPWMNIKNQHTSDGKRIRAEPIAALYENGNVFHCEHFEQLENELCTFTSDYDRKKNGSPGRLDSVVWALLELSGKLERKRNRGMMGRYVLAN